MPQVSTILTSYDKREGTGQRGAWVLHLYKDAGGTTYQTFEAPISNRAYGLAFTKNADGTTVPTNKPVVLTYEEKPARDPQYPPNKVIKDIQADTSAPAVSAAPVASQGTPTAVATIPANPTASSGGGTTNLVPVGNYQKPKSPEEELRIMRQSALERAIHWISATPNGFNLSLYATTEEFIHYFQTGEYPGKTEGEFLAELGNVFPDAA